MRKFDVEAARQRMQDYMDRNKDRIEKMFSKESIDEWAKIEEDIACKKCGRVIYCGNLDALCSDSECELKLRKVNHGN